MSLIFDLRLGSNVVKLQLSSCSKPELWSFSLASLSPFFFGSKDLSKSVLNGHSLCGAVTVYHVRFVACA